MDDLTYCDYHKS